MDMDCVLTAWWRRVDRRVKSEPRWTEEAKICVINKKSGQLKWPHQVIGQELVFTSSQDTFSFSDSACFFSFLVFTDMSLSPTFSSRSLASVGKAVQRMAPFTGLQAVQGDSMRYYAHCPGPEFPASITCLFLASTNAKQNRQEPVFLWLCRKLGTSPLGSHDRWWLQTW